MGADYMVQETGPSQYTVTKWEGKNYPTAEYRVVEGPNWSCNCPARVPCKHVALVKKWLKSGKPSYVDEKYLVDFLKKS